jgi:HPt (histidine-containing phosphotransfer) domain-containing protein
LDFTINAHALKSASASVGARDLAETLARLEAFGKTGDRLGIQEILDPCLDELAQIAADIRSVLNSLKDDSRPPLPAEEAVERLERLRTALSQEKVLEADELLSALKAGTSGNAFLQERLTQISNLILVFELEEAGREAGRIIEHLKAAPAGVSRGEDL